MHRCYFHPNSDAIYGYFDFLSVVTVTNWVKTKPFKRVLNNLKNCIHFCKVNTRLIKMEDIWRRVLSDGGQGKQMPDCLAQWRMYSHLAQWCCKWLGFPLIIWNCFTFFWFSRYWRRILTTKMLFSVKPLNKTAASTAQVAKCFCFMLIHVQLLAPSCKENNQKLHIAYLTSWYNSIFGNKLRTD